MLNLWIDTNWRTLPRRNRRSETVTKGESRMERGIRTSEKPVKQPTTEELLHEVNNYLISGLRNPETLHTKAQVANAIVMRVLARVGRVEGIVGLHFAVFLVRR